MEVASRAVILCTPPSQHTGTGRRAPILAGGTPPLFLRVGPGPCHSPHRDPHLALAKTGSRQGRIPAFCG